MSSISHSSVIEFPISLILRCRYILWSCPFQLVNPKVKDSYIKGKLDFPCKKFNLRLPVLNIFDGCAI